MNRYLLCDDYGDYKKLMNYNDLKTILIEEIERDTFENCDDKNIVINNFEIMKKLATQQDNYNYIKEELQGFGYYTQDLTDLQRDLSNFQAYKHGTGSPCIPHDCIYETLELIDKEMRG